MKFRTKRIILNIISSIIVLLTIFFCFLGLINIVFNFVYIRTPVKGYSMKPTINSTVPHSEIDGDNVFINKYKDIQVNDIVVAKVDWGLNLTNADDYIIKRLVGMPGDKIKITITTDEKTSKNIYNLYNNETLLYQSKPIDKSESFKSYINYSTYIKNYNSINQTNYDYILVGEDEYFLMGDNWDGSTDCLVKGPLCRNSIIGKVDFILPYNQNPLPYMFDFIFNEILF